MNRVSPWACRTLTPGLLALISCAGEAPARATVNVSVDATARRNAARAGVAVLRLRRDQLHDACRKEKRCSAPSPPRTPRRVHVRSHFLLNTGDGTPAMKWGSTNVYTEDAAGNPVYSWNLTDGIMDTITAAGAFPFVEIGFMPQALSTHPTPYRNASTTTLDGGCFYPPDRLREMGGAHPRVGHARE